MAYKKLLHINATMIFILIIGLYAGMVSAHGNVSLERDSCVRGTQGSKVHLSAYQPQKRAYCTLLH